MSNDVSMIRSAGRRRPWSWALLLVVAPLVGCTDNGLVKASGRVTIEGEPAVGRLLMTPIGEGKQSNSLIAGEGAFRLHTGGEEGAKPGTYHALFKVDPAHSIANGAGNAAGDGGRTLIYESPRQNPIVIPDAGVVDLLIEIGPDGGWTKSWSD